MSLQVYFFRKFFNSFFLFKNLASGDSGYTPKTATIKVEHAKSGTGKCFSCKEKIPKDELRISGRSSFYHVDCFHTANSDHKLFQKSAEE